MKKPIKSTAGQISQKSAHSTKRGNRNKNTVAELGTPNYEPECRLKFARALIEEPVELRREMTEGAMALKGRLSGKLNANTLNRFFYDTHGAKLVEVAQLFRCSSYTQILEKCNTAYSKVRTASPGAERALEELKGGGKDKDAELGIPRKNRNGSSLDRQVLKPGRRDPSRPDLRWPKRLRRTLLTRPCANKRGKLKRLRPVLGENCCWE